MKAVVAAFNQEKALVGAFSVITNLRMELFEALVYRLQVGTSPSTSPAWPPLALVGLNRVDTAEDIELARSTSGSHGVKLGHDRGHF